MSEHATLRDAILYFADFEHCRQFMVELRWPDGKVKCPQCGSDKTCYLAKNRVWKCYATHPKPRFTLKTGTIFEDSPIPLEKWLPAVWMLLNCKNGISSWELHRAIGVTQKTAWFMLHRIRLAAQSKTFNKLGGEVEVDETFIGGKARNMHHARRIRAMVQSDNKGKTVVLGMLERKGTIRTSVIPDCKKRTIAPELRQNVEQGTDLFTDELSAGWFNEYQQQVINHAEAYVKGNIHTNGIENFWSLLKRTLHGTYVSVEPFHLFRYVDEQAFRYNNRNMNDLERFVFAMRHIVGRRLTYKQLTGKVGQVAHD
jgi:transposase-like protein